MAAYLRTTEGKRFDSSRGSYHQHVDKAQTIHCMCMMSYCVCGRLLIFSFMRRFGVINDDNIAVFGDCGSVCSAAADAC